MSSFLTHLLCSLILITPANADQIFIDCPSNTNYTPGSAFQANLDALLSSLPGAAAASSSGFAENVTGAAPDQAYGLAQCRADVNASACRSCLDASVKDMSTKCTAGQKNACPLRHSNASFIGAVDTSARSVAAGCPGQKNAILIYEACLLRHCNASFFGVMDMSVWWYMQNPQNATQPAQFTSTVGALMKNLTAMAAYSSPRMFAAGSVVLTPFVNIYGMAQCTRDLAGDDCNRCLVTAVTAIPTCCNGKQGGRVIYRSCSIRFEVYPFYNVSAAEAAMSPASAPVSWTINGGNHSVQGSSGETRSSPGNTVESWSPPGNIGESRSPVSRVLHR